VSLREAIQKVLEHATPPPPSEAATLFRIIDPLLLAMGYSPLEIEPESSVSQWQRPDRTILPGTEHEWYLEAKAWGVSLDDEKHLQQATNYAHSRGQRWVVLTNGQVWRIYDDHITGLRPAERLVAEARLDRVSDLEQLLRAVSKPTVVSGGLGQFALRSRVSAILTRSLKDEGSEAIRALWGVIRRQPGMSEVSRRDVATYFRDLQAAVQPEPRELVPAAVRVERLQATPPPDPANDHDLESLARDARALATGCKPVAVSLPDGETTPATSWRDVACSVLLWLDEQGKVPSIPFRGGRGGKRYFLNVSPKHTTEPMHNGYRAVSLGGAEVYVDLHRSAMDLLGRLRDVCVEVGVPPSSIRVRVTADTDGVLLPTTVAD
jgi:hypothetical protein